jgi:hypothetical protein
MTSTRKTFAVILVGILLLGLTVWLMDKESPSSQPPVNNADPKSRVQSTPRSRATLPPMESSAPPSIITNVPPENGADLYREAFVLLEGLTADEKALLTNWRTNAVAPELCAKLKPITELAHRATTNCDWGVKFEGFSTPLPHLSQSRQLARALVWNAAHCRQEDSAGVSADLLAALRLGQNSSEFLIGHLVNTAIQGMALDYLAENAHSLPAATVAELMGVLSSGLYDESFYRAMECEAKGLEFEADRFTASTNDIQTLLQGISNDGRFASMSKEQIIAKMREVAALEREYVQAIGLPATDYEAWLTKLQMARQTNPLIDLLMPAFDSAMAEAGMRTLMSGPSVLSQYLDPATGQPFVYRMTAIGFELSSSFQIKGQPVKLEFRSQ